MPSFFQGITRDPVRAVRVSSWVVAFIFAALFGAGLVLYLNIARAAASAPEIRTALARIGRLDEEATRAATMAVATGDSAWRRRHARAVQDLYVQMEDLNRNPNATRLRANLNGVRDAHSGLNALEHLAFRWAEQGQTERAHASLWSEEYNALADQFTVELLQASEEMKAHAAELRRAVQRSLSFAGVLVLVAAGLLFLLRRIVLRSVREYIEDRRRTEIVLIEARAAAEVASQAKSDFLSRTSHELRTPLNAILGFGQILDMDLEKEENRESLDHILHAGRHLLTLIDEILDLAKIEAGEMRLVLEDVHLESEASGALELVRPLAAERGIELHLEDRTGEGTTARCDAPRLRQVLLNLLSNAIKFNRESGRVNLLLEPAGEDRVRLSVADTGLGIPREHLEQLFVPFHRGAADRHGVPGTGLGLSLSKGLIEAMGGTLTVESTEGEGSTFTLELLRGQQLQHCEPEAPDQDDTWTVLYVEDNVANQRLIERVLVRREGIKLVPAMTGNLGVELARQHLPDLVLLDLDLPDLPGEEVLVQLHAESALRQVPVVIVSADASESTRKRLLGMGAQAYLTKPINVARLLEVLDDCLPVVERR